MQDSRLKIANRMCVVLKRYLQCTCKYNVPYSDGQVKRKVTQKCERCKVIEEWENESKELGPVEAAQAETVINREAYQDPPEV